MTRHRSTFNRRDVIQHLCSQLHAAADSTHILACADRAVERTDVIGLRNSHRKPRYSTREVLSVEWHLIATARALRGMPAPFISD